ncbi:MAG: histidine phosphatase family protein [Pseudomonadota bacterium]
MTRLALLRHGPTEWNRAGRIQGRTDIPLDPQAARDLSALCLPPGWATARLWSSPLHRAAETAKLVARRDPEVSDALIEMDWGGWEGKKGADLRADPESGFRDIEAWGWKYQPPGGESPGALRDRLVPWRDGLEGDNIAVCHIGVMRVLMALATGWDFSGPAPFRVKRNRLFVLERAADQWRLAPEPVRLPARAP